MGRRTRRDPPTSEPVTPAVTSNAAVPHVAFVAALLFGVSCVAYIVTVQQPYPDGLAQSWLVVGIPILAGSALIGLVRWRVIVTLPSKALALLLRPPPLAFGLFVAGITASLGLAFAYYIFDRAPTTADEVAQLWHAKMLLSGHLSLPVDANREFFAIDNVVDQGRWYSEYPIGGPAVLAVGVLAGVPWAINPILAAATAAAMYTLMRRIRPEGEARACAALFCVMPMVVFMSGSHMNHVPVLLLTVLALLALIEWDRATTPARSRICAALVGCAVGVTATIRPLDAVVLAVCIGMFQLFTIVRDRRRFGDLAITAAAGVAAILPMLYANAATTGSPLRFAYEVLWGDAHRIGFHDDPWGTSHTIGRGIEYALWYINGLNLFATMWPVPILVIAIAGLVSMKRVTRWDTLLLGLFWCQVLAYAAYWHKGQFVGPRFLYTATPTVVALIARTPFLVGDRFGAFWRRTSVVFVLASIVYTWTFTEQRFTVWGLARSVHGTRQVVRSDIDVAVHFANAQHALVFVREPFNTRLLRRMWGLGMPRSEAAMLSARSDACSLVDAVAGAEDDSLASSETRLAHVREQARPYVHSDSSVRARDASVRISSRNNVSPACLAELADDERYPGGAFGPALLHNEIDASGAVTGDVVFVADLGGRNERLRGRFGDRKWYRLSVVQSGTLLAQPRLEPY